MKLFSILSLLLVTINAWAGPNLDTSSSIVTFPYVTVDNDEAYSNVELLLAPDGNWAVLSFEPALEPDFDLTGEWKGNLSIDYGELFLNLPPCDTLTSLTLIQKGYKLTGTGEYSGNCIENGGTGHILGVINGNSISFTLFINEQIFAFTGFISDDRQALDMLGPSIAGAMSTSRRRWLLSLQ